MKVIFLGVGEAFDERLLNNSHLVISKTKLLLDCGYAIPPQVWKYNDNQSFLDVIYISHFHADHYFGIAALLTRMGEECRTKKLIIIGQKGIKKKIKNLMEMAYKGFYKKLKFKIDYKEIKENQTIKLNELTLRFSPTLHPEKNLAIKISNKKHSICYSGDGDFSKKTEKMYKNSELIIHEAYSLNEEKPAHANINKVINMAKKNNVKCIALTHIGRRTRKNEMKSIKKMVSKSKNKVIIPKNFQEYILK